MVLAGGGANIAPPKISAINGDINMKFGTHIEQLIMNTWEKKFLTQVIMRCRQGPFSAEKAQKFRIFKNWPNSRAQGPGKKFVWYLYLEGALLKYTKRKLAWGPKKGPKKNFFNLKKKILKKKFFWAHRRLI